MGELLMKRSGPGEYFMKWVKTAFTAIRLVDSDNDNIKLTEEKLKIMIIPK